MAPVFHTQNNDAKTKTWLKINLKNGHIYTPTVALADIDTALKWLKMQDI